MIPYLRPAKSNGKPFHHLLLALGTCTPKSFYALHAYLCVCRACTRSWHSNGEIVWFRSFLRACSQDGRWKCVLSFVRRFSILNSKLLWPPWGVAKYTCGCLHWHITCAVHEQLNSMLFLHQVSYSFEIPRTGWRGSHPGSWRLGLRRPAQLTIHVIIQVMGQGLAWAQAWPCPVVAGLPLA